MLIMRNLNLIRVQSWTYLGLLCRTDCAAHFIDLTWYKIVIPRFLVEHTMKYSTCRIFMVYTQGRIQDFP